MDLNVSPLPEEDEEVFEESTIAFNSLGKHSETAVETFRRERDERRKRLRSERQNECHKDVSQQVVGDGVFSKDKYKSNDKYKLPPGWLDCPTFGHEIDFIIPSKVPLCELFDVPPGKRYSFKQLIHQLRVSRKRLGMVIDLTNTSNYYSMADFAKEGIKYVKIRCKGRDAVPENSDVNNFVFEVNNFFLSSSNSYILVHCTHGHNRTGYMIVHYLMRSRTVSVSEAIKIFSDARPPGIYKPDYIDALYTFYHERRPETVVCPPTPEWKGPSDLDLNGELEPKDEDDSSNSLLHDKDEMNGVMTNDDVLGDEIPNEQQSAFQQLCCQILKLNFLGRGSLQFPGSHPVSLNRDNLQLLRQRYYYATWKADGTRYMMLIMTDGCYLIDRSFRIRRVQLRFPRRVINMGLPDCIHHCLLLDGEMIIDTLPDSLKQERRYLIYDLMAVNGDSVIELPFFDRWRLIDKEVIEPRHAERKHIDQSRNPYYRYDLEQFRVRRKDFWLLSTVTKVLNSFIPRLSHAADGLIFQGWDDPYVARTHEGLLKWKYVEMNSVDFLFEVGADGKQFLYLLERGRKKLMDGNKIIFQDDVDLSSYSGKIVECSWSMEEQVWVCMRTRSDKSTPNDFNTYKKVMRSIRDNITEDILLGEIAETICLPMYADRIKNDSRAHMHAARQSC